MAASSSPPARDRGEDAAATTPFPTNEGLRILRAIQNGSMGVNSNGRYVIVGQDRPDRKTRERLTSRGLIEHHYTYGNGFEWRLTEKGRSALREVGFDA